MICIIKGNESHDIISVNVSHGEGKSELWITRPNGKNLKVFEHNKAEIVREYKEAIDFAIENGAKTFRIE